MQNPSKTRASMLVDPTVRDALKLAASLNGQSISDYCRKVVMPVVRADIRRTLSAAAASLPPTK